MGTDMKKACIPALLVVLMLALCACGACKHEWADATCTAPKTCAKCGETEGEPLGHDAGEASYWSAAVCSRCGEEVGGKLEPEFEKLGFDWVAVTDMDAPGIFPAKSGNSFYFAGEFYVSCCSEMPEVSTYGAIALNDYRVFESDETHAAKEGYEWRIAEFDIAFHDEMANRFGYRLRAFSTDYYHGPDDDVIALPSDGHTFSLDYKEATYDECYEDFYFESRWEDESIPNEPNATIRVAHMTLRYETLMPAGYDGVLLAFYDPRNADAGDVMLDRIDKNTVFVRLV